MKKWLRKATAIVATVTMFVSIGTPAFANEVSSNNDLSIEAMNFLVDHNVDVSIFSRTRAILDQDTAIANSYDESVLALKDATEAYQFTDEQVQKYVEGLVSTATTIVYDSDIAPLADNRPNDDGIGYEVKSKAGYYQETAYATLPHVDRAGSSSQYLFYTVSDLNENWGIDVGIWYASGNGVEAWRGCYNTNGTLTSGGIISGLDAGDKVYLTASIETNGYLRFRILDASNFNTVYYDISYYVGDKGISRTNACFNRQITLCNNAADFTTGAYCINAAFNDAYIYSTSGYSLTNTSNTISNRCGVFGTNSSNRDKVSINSYQKWYEEDINIIFR